MNDIINSFLLGLDTVDKWQSLQNKQASERMALQSDQMALQKNAMQLQQMQQQQQRAQGLEQAFSMLGANASPQDFAMTIFEYGDPEQMLQAKQMFDDSTRKSMATQFNILSSVATKNPKLAQKHIMALKEMADNGDNAILKDLFSAVDADFSEQDVNAFIGGALATIDPDSIKRAIDARQTSINEMNALTQREAMLRSQGRADEQFLYGQSQDAINNARLQQLADAQVANYENLMQNRNSPQTQGSGGGRSGQTQGIILENAGNAFDIAVRAGDSGQDPISALQSIDPSGQNPVIQQAIVGLSYLPQEERMDYLRGKVLRNKENISLMRAQTAQESAQERLLQGRENLAQGWERLDQNERRIAQEAKEFNAQMARQPQPTSQAIQDQAKLIASSAYNAEDPLSVLTSPEALKNPTIKALVDSVNAGNYANDEARTQAVMGAISNYIPSISRNLASVGRDVRANGVPVVVIDPNTGARTQLTKYKGGLYDQNGEQTNIPVGMAVPQEIINLSSSIKNLLANPPSQGRTALELASNKGLTSDITALSQRLSDYVGSTSQEDVIAYFEGNDIRVSDAQKTILRSMQQAISLLGTSKSQAWAETKELLKLYGGEKGGELDLTGALRNLAKTLSEKYTTNIESISSENVKASDRSKLIQRNNEILDALDNLVPPETIKTYFAPTLKRYLSPIKSSSSGGEVMLDAQMQGNSIVPTSQPSGQQQGAIRLKVVRKPDGTLGVE